MCPTLLSKVRLLGLGTPPIPAAANLTGAGSQPGAPAVIRSYPTRQPYVVAISTGGSRHAANTHGEARQGRKFLAAFPVQRLFNSELMMTDSQRLLADYVANGSEAAFRELVTRYLDLVYSAAIRLVNGDTHMAQDVVQTVFVDLARLARTFSKEAMLGGWLHRHTCFVAATLLRGERRRRSRERQVAEMNALNNQTDSNLAQLAPVLDEAINQLGAEDRKAILLRFFEQRDFRSVGEALGTSENAAQKRVSRALDELRMLLRHRGVAVSAVALGTALAGQTVVAAPAGLAASISAAALANAVAGGTFTSSLLKIMTTLQTKVAVSSVVAVIALGTFSFTLHRSQIKLRQENQSLRQQFGQLEQQAAEAERLLELHTNGKTLDESQVPESPALAERAARAKKEMADLRSEVARLRSEQEEQTNVPALALLGPMGQLMARIWEGTNPFTMSGGTNPVSLTFLDPSTNAYARAFGNQAKALAKESMMGRVSCLKERLNLTPDQTDAVQRVLSDQVDQQFSGRTRTASSAEELAALSSSPDQVDHQITALLNPEQQTAYGALKNEQQIARARSLAASEVNRLQTFLGLTLDQQDAAFAALYQQSLKEQSKEGFYTWQVRLEQGMNTLGAILTPSQLEAYRLYEQQAHKSNTRVASPGS